jgi:hypothetical protein
MIYEQPFQIQLTTNIFISIQSKLNCKSIFTPRRTNKSLFFNRIVNKQILPPTKNICHD